MNHAIRVCRRIAREIEPLPEERAKVYQIAEKIKTRLETEAQRIELDAEISLNGSVAKDTWLSHEVDLDIFLRVPVSVTRVELETKCIKAARRAVNEYPITERFAEHPYIETYVEDVRINIVPCYKVRNGEWISATDRTPFHTEYVCSHLRAEQRTDVRLLKKFLKGIEVYGADIKTMGFSGMLCETLVMYYGSFMKTLEEATRWRAPIILDIEGHYESREEEPLDLFDEPLIVVDPVDRARNLAASISGRKLWEFVAAARAFRAKPSERYFLPRKPGSMKASQFRRQMMDRGWNLMAVQFGRVEVVVDVLWSQLYRTEKALRNLLTQEGFYVSRSASWSDEKTFNLIIFELETANLAPVTKHMGPHISRQEPSEHFLAKHIRNPRTVSGPWVDGDRWAVERLREQRDAVKLLRKRLAKGGRELGVARRIASVLQRRYRVLAGKDLVELYGKNSDAAQFITYFLSGRPVWLE